MGRALMLCNLQQRKENKMARKYTLAEIDQMRELIRQELFGDRTEGYGYSSDMKTQLMVAQGHAIDAGRIEDRLRTYLTAGLGPEDLKQPT